jgi:pyruvate-ferredoxin/flavodoxin oxidoreductase
VEPINAQKGRFIARQGVYWQGDGTFPAGTTEYEKRVVAVNVPEWIAEKLYSV